MTTEQRLDKVETDFSELKKIVTDLANLSLSTEHKVNQLTGRVDLLTDNVNRLSDRVDLIANKLDLVANKVDDFVNTSTLEIEIFKARNEILDGVVLRLEENQKSSDAAVERLEAILSTLLKQNGSQ